MQENDSSVERLGNTPVSAGLFFKWDPFDGVKIFRLPIIIIIWYDILRKSGIFLMN